MWAASGVHHGGSAASPGKRPETGRWWFLIQMDVHPPVAPRVRWFHHTSWRSLDSIKAPVLSRNQSSPSSIFSNVTFLSHSSSAVPFLFSCLSKKRRLQRLPGWTQGWALVGYVRLGMTGSAPTRSSAGPHGIELNPTIFHARPCEEEDHVCLLLTSTWCFLHMLAPPARKERL